MSRTTVPSTAVDANSPLDEPLMTALDGNDDDHETRIAALEDPGARFFTHFNEDHEYGSDIIVDSSTTSREFNAGLRAAYGAGSMQLINYQGQSAEANDEHFVRFKVSAGTSSADGRLRGLLAWKYDARTAPGTFEVRIRLNSNSDAVMKIRIGLLSINAPDISAGGNPNSGIWIESTGSNWIMKTRSNGGAVTSGTAFAPPTVNTWLGLKILHENNAGEQARVLVDGSQKDLITTNLPTSRKIYPMIQWQQMAGGTALLDNDSWLFSFGGPLANLT